MTSFVDRDGRRCVLSWLREGASFDPGPAVRAGAHSLPYVVGLGEGGRLTLELHPDVDSLRGPSVAVGEPVAATAFEVTVMGAGSPSAVRLQHGASEVFRVDLAPGCRMIVDADIVEVLTGDAVLATRIARSGDPLQVLASGDLRTQVRVLG
jgi:hypothetical protein